MLANSRLNLLKKQIYFLIKSKVFYTHLIFKQMNGTRKEIAVCKIIINYNKFQENQDI